MPEFCFEEETDMPQKYIYWYFCGIILKAVGVINPETFTKEQKKKMTQRLTVYDQSKPCYDILFSASFADLSEELRRWIPAPEELRTSGFQERKIGLVTDSHVNGLYGAEVEKILKQHGMAVRFVFEAGEEQKTLKTVQELYAFLIENQFGRKDLLVALGGGVVGDLTGFTAATYMRGIDFIQIPTTLLAQVDSSIGGKTGVDFDGYKNMVGAFYMPRLVYINSAVLKTLPGRQYFSGFAEVMKYGLIKSSSFYEWLLKNMYEICSREEAVLEEMVWESCNIKKGIVEKDPREQGERALLNFGHTIGHAIEKASGFGLYHGECVALGAVAAAFISWKKEWLSMEEYYEIRDMFVPFGLPVSFAHIEPEEILKLTRSDKKAEGERLAFILLKKIGKAVIDCHVTEEDMLQAIKEIHFSEEDRKEERK